jgi:hypothetical protein
MSARIDLYLEQFRSRIPGAAKHTGLWPSNKSRPMCANGTLWFSNLPKPSSFRATALK